MDELDLQPAQHDPFDDDDDELLEELDEGHDPSADEEAHDEERGDPAPGEELPRRRRKRRSPPRSAAHEARIARYRQLVEERGWIFTPPTPERPISYLFDELTVKQIVTLGAPPSESRRRA